MTGMKYKIWRISNKIRQDFIAEKLGYTQAYISLFEADKVPSFQYVMKKYDKFIEDFEQGLIAVPEKK